MMWTLIGAGTVSWMLTRAIVWLDNPKKSAKNRPSAGTLKRSNVTR